jgi:hypothetical protein
MPDEVPPRSPPQSTVQAVSHVAEDVVRAMHGQPVLIGLLLLNAIGIGGAIWFLDRFAASNAARLDLILKSCLPQT